MDIKVKLESDLSIQEKTFNEYDSQNRTNDDLSTDIGYKAIVKREELDEDFQGDAKEILPATTSSFAAPGSNYSRSKSTESYEEIKIEEFHAKIEILISQPVVAVITAEKMVFNDRNFVCSVCFDIFPSNRSLVIHRNSHLKSDFKSDVSTNMKFNIEKCLKCEECDYTCVYVCQLKYHQNKHSSDKPVDRDQCDEQSKHRKSLKKYSMIHSREKKKAFKCDKCGFQTAFQHNLNMHLRTHEAKKTYACNQCEYKSQVKKNFKMHEMKHTRDKKFKCGKCGYSCASKRCLIVHLLHHAGEKPYACDVCDFKTADSINLTYHKTTHSVEKQFSCDLCEYKSTRKQYVKVHRMTHSVEKPFACDACDFSCSRRSGLESHNKTHSRENLFSCDLCDGKFVSKSGLAEHKARHLIDKSHKCVKCDFKSTRKRDMKKHYKTHSE